MSEVHFFHEVQSQRGLFECEDATLFDCRFDDGFDRSVSLGRVYLWCDAVWVEKKYDNTVNNMVWYKQPSLMLVKAF